MNHKGLGRVVQGGVAMGIALLLTACASGGGEQEKASLVIGGWGGATNEGTKKYYLDPYEAETGVTASFDDAPGTQLASVQAQVDAGKVQWDLVDSLSGDLTWTMWDRGLLEPLPADVHDQLVAILGEEKVTEFGFTHANSAKVIACNMDVMTACPQSMEEFFDVDKFPQSRTMSSAYGPFNNLSLATLASGVSSGDITTTPIDIDAAIETLEKVKPTVKVWYESGDQEMQIMRSGEAEMGILSSHRAYQLLPEGMNLEIVWNGGLYDPSYWAVVKDAPNKEAAFDFLIWLAKNAEGQAGLASEMFYSVPNPEAFEIISDDVRVALADYPANFELLGTPNYAWYSQNADEVHQAFADFLKG